LPGDADSYTDAHSNPDLAMRHANADSDAEHDAVANSDTFQSVRDADSDSNSDSYADADANSHADGDSDSDPDPDAYTDPYTDPDSHAELLLCDADTITDAQPHADVVHVSKRLVGLRLRGHGLA
jgi:hypothetical protein